jgi:ribosome biogenesis GTPase
MKRALVIRGSRNIFTVRLLEEDSDAGKTEVLSNHQALLYRTTLESPALECRIKGKVLKGVESYYNPLAPGDIVTVEENAGAAGARPGTAMILAVEERRNRFTRFNQKGLGANRSAASQLLAANVDLILCVVTPVSPPFRPRFLDRALVQAEISGIPAVIVCNKWDIADGDIDTDERLQDFERIGYPVLRVSAATGEGLLELRRITAGKLSVLVGQSGVGKSSLINALLPEAAQRVGDINEKYDRGNHTTTMSVLFEDGERRFIDTPGIRRLLPDGISGGELILYMKEFAPLAGKCSYGLSCSHETEPGCKILEAVDAGVIHEDRYDSYLRIREELLQT